MASLEDTFRMMKGEEPVNTNRLTAEDKNFNENRSKYKNAGSGGGKITTDLLNSIGDTLVEMRTGVKTQPKNIKETHSDLVENAKVLTALLNSIKDHRLDERVLLNVSRDIKSLTDHLSVYPEFDDIIKRRIK